MWSALLDHHLMHWTLRRLQRSAERAPLRFLDTPLGRIRLTDTGGQGVAVLFVPDGPNVVEHYNALIEGLVQKGLRVVCFDMPGFGFSVPHANYAHSLIQGADAVRLVLDHLHIGRAVLAFSCANGFYALRFAQLAPNRVIGLLLSQTPSVQAMHAWTDRVVPKVLRIPVLGQALSWLFREKAASSWYRIALPKTTAAEPMRSVSLHALRCGACFSLAGVVQGLLREPNTALVPVTVPCTVVWGTQDRSHRFTAADSVLSVVAQAKIIRFEDCGHFPDLEQVDRYIEVLTDSLLSWSSGEAALGNDFVGEKNES
jgi:pimeloyl-ACP methyl ester carboxylesterase